MDTIELARQARRRALTQIHKAKSGHPGGSLSAADILAVLYGAVLRPQPYVAGVYPDPQRDVFVLSKGHAAPALYGVLTELGVWLGDLRRFGHPAQGHPAHLWSDWVETSTGSLGQGFAVAVGLAKALQPQGRKVYCLLGDGECHEGIITEAARLAVRWRLANLIVLVDYNQLQSDAHSELLADPYNEFKACGWGVFKVDGHNHTDLQDIFSYGTGAWLLPTFIQAKTIKGKGVSFMENNPDWHGSVVMSDEQLELALAEL